MNIMILNSLLTNLSNGVVTFVLGMGIVFIVLILLIYIIKAITAIARGNTQKEDTPAPVAKPIDPVPELVPAAPVGQQEDEEEIIAVIAAAVAAIAASEGTRLSVRSYRRVGAQAPAWSRAGREDIMANRF